MRDTGFKSRNLLTFLLGIVAVAAIALLAVLIWNSQAAPAPQPPATASVQLNPTAGLPGSDITVTGANWQAGEPVLVYLVETESGATDGVVYAGAAADRDGQISIRLPYPPTGLWAGKETVWSIVNDTINFANISIAVNHPGRHNHHKGFAFPAFNSESLLVCRRARTIIPQIKPKS